MSFTPLNARGAAPADVTRWIQDEANRILEGVGPAGVDGIARVPFERARADAFRMVDLPRATTLLAQGKAAGGQFHDHPAFVLRVAGARQEAGGLEALEQRGQGVPVRSCALGVPGSAAAVLAVRVHMAHVLVLEVTGELRLVAEHRDEVLVLGEVREDPLEHEHVARADAGTGHAREKDLGHATRRELRDELVAAEIPRIARDQRPRRNRHEIEYTRGITRS